MKVSTDACIQGAWAAKQLQLHTDITTTILDIGTGTGLLTLMLAQALPAAHFDAIEINEDACQQAKVNFENADWNTAFKTHPTSLTAFVQQSSHLYDFIICNPPFFQNHLESGIKARNDARHSQSLSKEELAESMFQLLQPEGQCCIMFPATEWENWIKIANKNNLFLQASLDVKPKPQQAPNRIIGILGKQKMQLPAHEELIIYTAEKQYSIKMRKLLKEYYLAF